MKACVNGTLVDEGDARVSVLDGGLLYGYGIFETMLVVDGRVFRPGRHLSRLRGAASAVHMPLPWTDRELAGMVGSTLEANKLADAYVRLTVTRGAGEPRMSFTGGVKPSVIVLARGLPAGARDVRPDGVRLAVSREYSVYSRDPRMRIKSTNYLVNALAKQEAEALGVDDVVLLNEKGFVTECPTANIFAVSGGVLITPPVDAGLLPGVTREAVIEVARQAGVPFDERNLTADGLKGADEAFKTSSIMGVVPVTEIDGVNVGGGGPGQVTMRLREGYRQLIRKECG